MGGIWGKGRFAEEWPHLSDFDARPSTLDSKMLMTNGHGVHEWSPQDQQFVLFDGQGQTTPPMQVKLEEFNEDIFHLNYSIDRLIRREPLQVQGVTTF